MKFRSSYIWAALVALGAAGWMASGMLGGDAGAPEATTAQQANSSGADAPATSSANSAAATAGIARTRTARESGIWLVGGSLAKTLGTSVPQK